VQGAAAAAQLDANEQLTSLLAAPPAMKRLSANCMMLWLRELSEFAAVLPTLRLWLASSISCLTRSTLLTLCSCNNSTTGRQAAAGKFKFVACGLICSCSLR
jgi:hypothetical protein